jgi:tetratricopeptide (TPR) repeat protein
MPVVSYEQAVENAKRIKADVARAKIYIARGDILKSVEAFISALTAKIATPMAGSDKNVIEPQMAEFCEEFSNNYQVIEFLKSIDYNEKPFIKFRPGLDSKVLNKLTAFRLKKAAVEQEANKAVERERQAKLDELLSKGKELLASGQAAKGKVMLKRAAEQFGSKEGVLSEVGRLMLDAGYPGDAMEILRQAMAGFPKDPVPYKSYIEACLAQGNNAEAEEAYLNVIKVFGPHPQTYLNMSKFYVAWRKNDLAYDYAQRAFGMDSSLTEAKEIMDRFG